MEAFSWVNAIKHPAKEFKLTTLKILEGAVPKNIRGALFRNGPGRLERGGRIYDHWFDGDGAILGVYFGDNEPSAIYKYVDTEFLIEEEKAGKLLYDNFSTKVSGLFGGLFNRKYKNK